MHCLAGAGYFVLGLTTFDMDGRAIDTRLTISTVSKQGPWDVMIKLDTLSKQTPGWWCRLTGSLADWRADGLQVCVLDVHLETPQGVTAWASGVGGWRGEVEDGQSARPDFTLPPQLIPEAYYLYLLHIIFPTIHHQVAMTGKFIWAGRAALSQRLDVT